LALSVLGFYGIEHFFYIFVITSPHFRITTVVNPFKLNYCLDFKQMKTCFNVSEYGLLKQMIGSKKWEFWTLVRGSWQTLCSIAKPKSAVEVNIQRKM